MEVVEKKQSRHKEIEEELLREAGRKRLEAQRKLSKKQLEEYKRIMEENDNH